MTVMREINLPRKISIGKKNLYVVKEIVERSKNPVVINGKKTRKIAGKKVAGYLNCNNIIIEKKDMDAAENIEDYVRENDVDCLVGVGGGSVIDVAKLAAYNSKIPYVSIPTIFANDGIASPMVSIKNGKAKESIKAKSPYGVIVDMEIVRKSPYEFLAAGVGDSIAKYTAVRDWKLGSIIKGEYYGDYASSLSEMIAKVVSNNVYEIRKKTDTGINALIEALISSGAAMGIAGSSRPASGSEHKFSHALDLILEKPGMHGYQCGLGTIIMSYLQGQDWKRIKNVLEIAKCPTTAKKIKLDKETLIEALIKAKEIKPERYTIIEHIRMDRKIAENALESTEII